MFWRFVFLFFGVFACSTSVIWIKSSGWHPAVVAAARLTLASVLLAPLAWREFQRHRASFPARELWRTTAPALVLAAHFISWNYGARMTIAAQATLVVNLVPVATPFFLHALVGERINRAEIWGTTLALAGIVVLSLRDAFAPGGDALGNAVCFGSMLLFAWYLALGRKNRDFPSLWLYVVPVYAQAAVICALVSLPWWHATDFGRGREWLLMLALAVAPTIVGHSLLNASMRHLRGQVVSLCNVAQFVFAGLMASLIFHETPHAVFYAASVLAVAGVVVVVFAAPPQPRLR